MTVAGKPKRLFKVASEFNVSTQSIVDALKKDGFSIENKPNAKITPDMYSALESLYSEDKAKSKDHIRAREEYEERRSSLRSSKNESLSIDNLLEPLDSVKADEKEKTEEVPDDSLPLQPIDEEKQPTDAVPAETIIDKPDSEKEEESKEKIIEQEEDSAPDEPSSKTDALPTEEEQDDAGIKEEEIPEKTKDLEAEEEDKKQVTQEPSDQETLEDQTDIFEELDEDEISDIIRGRKEKLAGTRLLGKIDIQEPLSSAPGRKKKKRKGKKETETETKKSTEPEATKKKKVSAKKIKEKGQDDKEEAIIKPKKKKRIKSRKAPVIETSEVESRMKETMAMLSGSSVGKKRQKRRKQKREEMAAERELKQTEKTEQEEKILEVSEFITVSDLADLLNVPPNEIITHCMNLGMVVSINQRLEAGTIELLAGEYGRDAVFVDAQELTDDLDLQEEDDPDQLKPRSPVVTVMGHVDHGKTSLLDYIRKTKVTAGEAGGITQHIGAYEVKLPDKRNITFLDTPGHEAFTAMRARGAQVTDIVILVVAADDAVMPQTIEAINHAQAGSVPIVVAINKMDKEGASSDKIKQQLTDYNVLVEEWGGNVQVAEVSAHTGQGIDELLEKVLIEAELMELKANPDRMASGIILESKVDRGKGVVSNILIQRGTLRIGDPFVAGSYSGRARALENEFGERILEAGPSCPAQLTGFDGIPQAGDKIVAVADDRIAREIAQQRQQIKREQSLRKVKHVTLDDISRRMALGEMAELNIIIKGDVDGSIEALSGALQKISNEEVKVNIIHHGVGAISESDVLLASASDAIIIGFQVRPSANARKLAENEEIDIRLFSVIYDAVDAVRDALEGLLTPEVNEKIIATAEVLETFKVPKAGTIAGCKVVEGKINRNTRIRLIRDGIVIYEGELASLKRFKDDVKEVAGGYECGMSIKNYNDIKVGDVIEGYELTETKRKLKTEVSE